MIPIGRLILLDTNILVLLARGAEASRRLNERYQLTLRTERPLVSVVSIGELLRLANRNNWGDRRRELVELIFRQVVVIEPSRGSITSRYADLGAISDSRGLNLSENDLWIASSAAETGCVLLTTDRDFLPLHPGELDVEWVDPLSLR